MKVLVVASLFPNRIQPIHAVFVRNRVLETAKLCELRVVSPIPYFPLAGVLKRYAHRRHIPAEDSMAGVPVHYPRFLSIPAILKPLDGVFLFLSVWWTARRLRRDLGFDFDLIDAHLAYPDGFGCALLARWLSKPLVVTLRGHDINDLPRYPVRRRQVRFALRAARRVIGVAQALVREAVQLGCPAEKAEVIPNGVDGAIFRPADRLEARARLSLPARRRIILSVGHLVERKGFHLLVDALKICHDAGHHDLYLVIVGGPGEEGDATALVRGRIEAHGLSGSVLLAGARPNETLGDWYSAADVFCLASEKEGRANVLVEALACGTPVVATGVWGTPEVITSPAHGILVERTAESIAAGILAALSRPWDRREISRHGCSQTWEAAARAVSACFERAVGE